MNSKGFHFKTSAVFVNDASHSVEQAFAANPSLSAAQYKKLYRHVLTAEQRAEFAALPVERQMGLLCVPVRRQAAYKKTGVEAYLLGAGKEHPRGKNWEDFL